MLKAVFENRDAFLNTSPLSRRMTLHTEIQRGFIHCVRLSNFISTGTAGPGPRLTQVARHLAPTVDPIPSFEQRQSDVPAFTDDQLDRVAMETGWTLASKFPSFPSSTLSSITASLTKSIKDSSLARQDVTDKSTERAGFTSDYVAMEDLFPLNDSSSTNDIQVIDSNSDSELNSALYSKKINKV